LYPKWWEEKEQKRWSADDEPFTYPEWWTWTGAYYESGGETYLKTWNLDANSIVVDVGAYRGVWFTWMQPKYPCHYYLIEPSPYSFDALKKVVGAYAKAHLFNVALWTEDGQGTLCDIQRDGANLFGTVEPRAKVQLVDAVRFFTENKLDVVDVMSVNIEGAEFQLLPYFVKTGLVKRIKNLMIQWHYDTTQPHSERQVWKIRETLVPTHRMAWNLGAWECWERKEQ
jgi:FkbM family methyltransferase